MTATCAAVPGSGQYASGMLGFLDCQASMLGVQGFAALAAPGSAVAALLGIALTLLIALFGYRMLLGDTPTPRDGVLAFVKVGVVLAFASSWPAYQAVVYDVVVRAPGQIAAELSRSAELPGAEGDLSARLDAADEALRALAVYGPGNPPQQALQQIGPSSYAPPPWLGFDTFALGVARITLLVTAVGGFAVVRIGAALLLALGPLFFLFLLFDGTRGLFEGWLRGLIGVALGALASALLLGVELALLEPWLGNLLARRAAELDIIGAPAALLAATIVFALTLVGLLALMVRVGAGLRLPSWQRMHVPMFATGSQQSGATGVVGAAGSREHVPLESRSRAAAIGDAVGAMQRREERTLAGRGSSAVSGARVGTAVADLSGSSRGTAAPRRHAARVSASSRRRDRA